MIIFRIMMILITGVYPIRLITRWSTKVNLPSMACLSGNYHDHENNNNKIGDKCLQTLRQTHVCSHYCWGRRSWGCLSPLIMITIGIHCSTVINMVNTFVINKMILTMSLILMILTQLIYFQWKRWKVPGAGRSPPSSKNWQRQKVKNVFFTPTRAKKTFGHWQ